jgi:hypothetical protein
MAYLSGLAQQTVLVCSVAFQVKEAALIADVFLKIFEYCVLFPITKCHLNS